VRPGVRWYGGSLAIGRRRHGLAVKGPLHVVTAGADGDQAKVAVVGQHRLQEERDHQKGDHAATTANVVP
jgi:hypothetical protein